MEKKKQWIINAVFYFIIGGGLYLAITYLLPVFMPFLVAFLFASLIHVIVKHIPVKTERRKRWLAVFLTAIFYICIVVVMWLVCSLLMHLVQRALLSLPRLYEQEFVPWIYSIAERLEQRYGGGKFTGFENIGERFLELVGGLGENLSEVATDRIKNMSGFAKNIPSFIVKIVMMVVSTFFLASDYEKIVEFVMALLPKKGQSVVSAMKRYILEVVTAYLKSYSLLMLLTFVELCMGLAILEIPYFFIISFAIAVFDILPVLGTGGILIPWAVAAVLIGNYKLAVGLALLDLVISIVRNTMEPRIVGRQIGVHPLATLIALFVGLKLCGFVGMFVFPMCLSILVQFGKEEFLKKNNEKEQ